MWELGNVKRENLHMHTETTAQQRNFLCAKTEKPSQILSLGFSMARDCEAEKKKKVEISHSMLEENPTQLTLRNCRIRIIG